MFLTGVKGGKKMAKLTYSTSDSIIDYITKSAESMGLSKSAFITLCINQQKQTQESIAMTAQFNEMYRSEKLANNKDKDMMGD